MAKKIGELLVERKLITRSQLARALQTQLISGGHLGTCLVELGYTDVDRLGETLADALKMRYARPEMLCGLPEWVLGALTPEQVEKYQVVPIGREDRTVHLAVISAARLSSLSAETGYRIVPWIAPEIRILEAMEQYYGIPRRPRFLSLSPATNDTKRPRNPAVAVPAPGAGLSPIEEKTIHAPAAAAPAPPDPAPSPMPIAVRYTATMSCGSAGRGEVLATAAAEAPREPTREQFLDRVAARFTEARDRDGLAAAVVAHTSRYAHRCILFGVRSDVSYVWDWSGIDLEPSRAVSAAIPLMDGSIFELLDGEELFWGRLPGDGRYDGFYRALGLTAPEEVLLLPVYVNDRLVAVLYAEGSGTSPIGGDAETWCRLIQKLSLAVSLVILKKKIHEA